MAPSSPEPKRKLPPPPKAKKRMGAPPGSGSKFTEALAETICINVGKGIPLAEIVRTKPGMPSLMTVFNWLEAHPDFALLYARARVAGYDMIAEDMLRIANTPVMGERRVIKGKVVEITKEDALGHRKLQVDTRRWLLSKWDPKRYGDATTVRGDPDNPLSIEAILARLD